MEGVVYKSTGANFLVKVSDGRLLNCLLKGSLKQEKKRSTSLVVVGDWVLIDIESEDRGIITEVFERTNTLTRKSVNLSKEQHILAANIDLVLLLITLENPKTYTTFVDRILVSAEASHINPILIFNKIDTYSTDLLKTLDQWIQTYESIGYPCLKVSALKSLNIQSLKNLIQGKTVLITGVSGSGKSSLVKAMDGSIDLKIGQMSQVNQQGLHTTTFSELFELSFGAKIIDTPGIRGFGITDLEKSSIRAYFPEFVKLEDKCRFHNCTHINEPGCAVLEAVSDKKISETRYKTYLDLMMEFEQSRFRRKN